jgi:hypothetical protein
MVRPPDQRSADRLPTFSRHCLLSVSIDQLDKADAPLIPETYIYLLGVQCLLSLSDGLAGYSFPLYNTIAVQKPPAGSYGPTRPYYAARNRASQGRATNCTRDAERRLAHSFLTTNLSIFGDALGALQTLARAAGCLPLPTPRDAFLTALAFPPRVIAALDEPQQAPSALRYPVSLEGLSLGLVAEVAPHQLPGLSPRNLACLRLLVVAALFLAGTPGSS